MIQIQFRVMLLATLIAGSVQAQNLGNLLGINTSATNNPAVAALSSDQVTQGLKEALGNGVQHAITNLGRSNGFLSDAAVKIPLPATLQKTEKTLRTLGEGQLVDNFVTTMNHAAEQAVPQAASVLGDSVKQMSLADAKVILVATNAAATAYFRRTSETTLHAKLLPIIKQATSSVGVTKAYKAMTDKIGGNTLSSFGSFGSMISSKVGTDSLDVDDYVTRKALDGLFTKIAEEEKLIRQNPVARTTTLLQNVFGAVSK